MRKFLSLPQEKQDRIVYAAMKLFGEVGYKKAYISEIAAASGISKALVFHYFKSKKGLYSYLVYFTGKIVMTEAQHERDTADKDFFDRVISTIKFRLTIKKRYPAISLFMESVYNEDEPEVAADIKRLLAIAKDMHSKVELISGEENIFKRDVDPVNVVNLVEKYMEGLVLGCKKDLPVDVAMHEATMCLNLLRNNLCR